MRGQMSLRELSRKSGLSLSHLQYLEKDARWPGDETVRRLATALGQSEKKLLALRENRRLPTNLTVLLREAEKLSDEEREELMAIARAALGPDG